MTYQEKVESARAIVDEHNSNLISINPNEDTVPIVDFECFLKSLQTAGGTTEESLSACSWEALEKFGIPPLLAHRVAMVFRNKENQSKTRGYISSGKLKAMTPKELLEHYNPNDKRTPVVQYMKDVFKDVRFIVFSEDGAVDIDTSLKLLADIDNGYAETETAIVNERPSSVYKVGESPNAYAEENPIYPGRLLRSGGVCDQTNRSWSGINFTVSQILWLAVKKTEEISVSSVQDAHDIMDKVLTNDNEMTWRQRCPEASKLHDEMKGEGRLPSLRIKIGRQSDQRENDPFYKKNRRW